MCLDCKATYWGEVAQEVLDSGSLGKSDETFVDDVAGWIADNAHVTPAQIEKIKEKADLVGVEYES